MSRALLIAGTGGSSFAVPPPSGPGLPTNWGVTRYASNPVFYVLGAETTEMYNPATLRLASGDIWGYVKGALRIYAWKSTDGGETFSIQNGGSQVVGPGGVGTWDHYAALEPMVVYDSGSSTIHLWYKGYNTAGGTPGIGHATASSSDPLTFTKDAGNPIWSAANVATQLGGGSVTDLSTGSVIKIGSTYHFYGYAQHNGTYKLIHGTGTTWNDPSGATALLSAGSDPVVETPDVILLSNGIYAMLYSIGGNQPDPRYVRAGSSSDGTTWDFSNSTNILAPTGSGWEKDETYSGHFIKENAAPYATPYTDGSGRWLFYYSGEDSSGPVYQGGLAYMSPTF